jgi:hypothetical protein
LLLCESGAKAKEPKGKEGFNGMRHKQLNMVVNPSSRPLLLIAKWFCTIINS